MNPWKIECFVLGCSRWLYGKPCGSCTHGYFPSDFEGKKPHEPPYVRQKGGAGLLVLLALIVLFGAVLALIVLFGAVLALIHAGIQGMVPP